MNYRDCSKKTKTMKRSLIQWKIPTHRGKYNTLFACGQEYKMGGKVLLTKGSPKVEINNFPILKIS